MTARVLLAAHRLVADHPTGIQRYTDELVLALAAVADPAELRFDLVAAAEPVDPTWVPPHVGIRRLRGPRRVANLAWTALAFPPIEAHVGRADLVHVMSTAIAVPSRAPEIVTVHDLIPIHHPEWMEARPAWACRRALAFTARHARRIIVPSQLVHDDICRTLGIEASRVRVIPEGVSDRFRATPSPAVVAEVRARHRITTHEWFVMVGAVSLRKNVPVVLRAVALLRETGVALPTLVLAGPADVGTEEVRALCAELGLDDVVRVAGFVSDADLAVLVSGAVALLHPSLDEGFGLTPLEAMAAGVPAVVSGAGAVAEVVGDAAVVVPPADAEGWAQALHRLRADADLRTELAGRGRARAVRFTWSEAARRTIEVYREVLTQRD